MGISDAAGEVVKALIPPNTNDLGPQQRWRWVVFASIVTLSAALGVHIALACGFLSQVYPGFASANDTKQIQKRVDVIASISIEQEIRHKAQILCTEHDQNRRNDLTNDIANLQREYRDITGTWYKVPTCDQL